MWLRTTTFFFAVVMEIMIKTTLALAASAPTSLLTGLLESTCPMPRTGNGGLLIQHHYRFSNCFSRWILSLTFAILLLSMPFIILQTLHHVQWLDIGPTSQEKYSVIALIIFASLFKIPIYLLWNGQLMIDGLWARHFIHSKLRFKANMAFLKIVDYSNEDPDDKLALQWLL